MSLLQRIALCGALVWGACWLSTVQADDAAKKSEVANPYIGEWYFVSGEYTLESGEVVTSTNADVTAIKSVGEDTFALVQTHNGVYKGYLKGSFSVDGKTYTEVVTESPWDGFEGKRFSFEGRIVFKQENGMQVEYWYHEGMVNGTLEKEYWKRLR